MNKNFSSIVRQWFAMHRRPLPWRQTRDPYAVWLSEVILQQTRIRQGQAYWERFMRRWPAVEDLAAASEDEVLREWQGLGYYSRARNLHAASRQIVEMGGFPSSYEGIRQLKGVGDYTAAAIASIAFGLPYAVVDGNVYRVLARYFGIDTPINTTEGKHLFATLAQQLLPADCASEHNQAMMDFGALQCTPQMPQCHDCLLADTCEALYSGRTSALPVKLKKLKIRNRRFAFFYLRCMEDGQVMTALRRRPAGDIWQGLWEPPMVELPSPLPEFSGEVTLLKQNVKHVLTHQVIHADFYLVETSVRPPLTDPYIWIPEADIDRYAVPRLVELLFDALE